MDIPESLTELEKELLKSVSSSSVNLGTVILDSVLKVTVFSKGHRINK